MNLLIFEIFPNYGKKQSHSKKIIQHCPFSNSVIHISLKFVNGPMKRFSFFLLLLCIKSFSSAQTSIPIDPESKQALIKDVVDVPGATKADLYDRTLAWITKFYPNPTGMVQSKNPETGEIIGKAQFKIISTDKKGVVTNDGFVAYTITLNFKDGKFKYEITRIHWVQGSYYDISKWLNTKDPYYKPSYEGYIQQSMTYFENLKTELRKAVKSPPVKKKDDW